MKVLLDENIDVRLKKAFARSEHEVCTVRDMGWNGIKNGELLRKMSEVSFDILVAVDKNLPYQQNTNQLPVGIFILDVHRNVLPALLPLVPKLLEKWQLPLEKKVFLIKAED